MLKTVKIFTLQNVKFPKYTIQNCVQWINKQQVQWAKKASYSSDTV